MKHWTLNGGKPIDPAYAAGEIWSAWSSQINPLNAAFAGLTVKTYDPKTGRQVGAPIRLDGRTSERSLGRELDARGRLGMRPERDPRTGRKEVPFRDLVVKVDKFHKAPWIDT